MRLCLPRGSRRAFVIIVLFLAALFFTINTRRTVLDDCFDRALEEWQASQPSGPLSSRPLTTLEQQMMESGDAGIEFLISMAHSGNVNLKMKMTNLVIKIYLYLQEIVNYKFDYKNYLYHLSDNFKSNYKSYVDARRSYSNILLRFAIDRDPRHPYDLMPWILAAKDPDELSMLLKIEANRNHTAAFVDVLVAALSDLRTLDAPVPLTVSRKAYDHLNKVLTNTRFYFCTTGRKFPFAPDMGIRGVDAQKIKIWWDEARSIYIKLIGDERALRETVEIGKRVIEKNKFDIEYCPELYTRRLNENDAWGFPFHFVLTSWDITTKNIEEFVRDKNGNLVPPCVCRAVEEKVVSPGPDGLSNFADASDPVNLDNVEIDIPILSCKNRW